MSSGWKEWPDGWHLFVKNHYVHVISGQVRSQVYRANDDDPWVIYPSIPVMTEPDLETACVLAVLLYRIEGE